LVSIIQAKSHSYFYQFLLTGFVWSLFVKDCKTKLKTLAWGLIPVLASLSPAICPQTMASQ